MLGYGREGGELCINRYGVNGQTGGGVVGTVNVARGRNVSGAVKRDDWNRKKNSTRNTKY